MPDATLVIDRTHLGRRASGIERITEELFSERALQPLPVAGFAGWGRNKAAMMAAQAAGIPMAMAARRSDVWVFSGFPPTPLASLFRERAVLYVHDLFLIERGQDLNRAGRFYMAPSFRSALKRLRFFLTISETTAAKLAPHVAPDAEIRLYRPEVRDVFALADSPVREPGGPLVLGTVGTVEPRKNLPASLDVALALGRVLGRPVEFHVIGRTGWGGDAARLARDPHVRLHGFQPDSEARRLIRRFDALICTSHDEGLGLPLLEAQYGGLQVIAPDSPVFREVLGASGLFIDPSDPSAAGAKIAAHLAHNDWRERAARKATANLTRWNTLASIDRAKVTKFLSERLTCIRGGRASRGTHLRCEDIGEGTQGGSPHSIGDQEQNYGFPASQQGASDMARPDQQLLSRSGQVRRQG